MLLAETQIKNKIIFIRDEEIIFSPLRAAFFVKKKWLVISDLHLGKTAHFRQHGIPVTAEVMQSDLHRLAKLVCTFGPQKIIVVGDMFHHQHNSDVCGFELWRKSFHHVEILLVAGNHDRLVKTHYEQMQIASVPHHECDGFYFVHELPKTQSEKFFVCGHLHPGVVLNGKARQSICLPCFVLHENYLILPAFSEFTGLERHTSRGAEHICYAIADGDVFAV